MCLNLYVHSYHSLATHSWNPQPCRSCRAKFEGPSIDDIEHVAFISEPHRRERLKIPSGDSNWDPATAVDNIFILHHISNNLHDLNNIPSTFTDNTANMAPSAVAAQVAETASGRPQAVGPPRLYPVKEAHFEGYISPQPDGYRKAQQMGSDNVAIVIDNGMNAARLTISVSLISY